MGAPIGLRPRGLVPWVKKVRYWRAAFSGRPVKRPTRWLVRGMGGGYSAGADSARYRSRVPVISA